MSVSNQYYYPMQTNPNQESTCYSTLVQYGSGNRVESIVNANQFFNMLCNSNPIQKLNADIRSRIVYPTCSGDKFLAPACQNRK
jgi:hypothetical protein